MASAYLNLAAFRARTVMSAASVSRLETQRPNFLQHRLEMRSRLIDARLKKRYAVPFPVQSTTVEIFDHVDAFGEPLPTPQPRNPPEFEQHEVGPEIVALWLTQLVTLDAYKALGFQPGSEQDQTIIDDARAAEEALAEAADATDGLFDLPLNQATEDATSITKRGALGYSELSPYINARNQARAARYGR